MASKVLDQAEAPWYAAFPCPSTTAASASRSEVRRWLQDVGEGGHRDYVIVDLRRNDYEGGTIRGSINLPAQSLYPTIPQLYDLFSAASIKKVVWYCGSCRGRGTRAAGWFADYINGKGSEEMQSLVLEGGIKGWANAGPEYVQMMDGYEASKWERSSSKS